MFKIRYKHFFIGLLVIYIFGFNVIQCKSITYIGKIYHPITKDNWPLTIEYFPHLGKKKRTLPLIAVHGLMANRNYFRITGEKSLIHYLRREGYDVYLMDMRGRRQAGSPSWFFGKRTYSYNVDDYIKYDMDAAINFVTKHSSSKKVIWMGHSMGGIIAYGRLGSYNENRIEQLITIASPAIMPPINNSIAFTYKMKGALNVFPVVPIEILSSFEGDTGIPFSPRFIEGLLWAPDSMERDVEVLMYKDSTSNISKGVIMQFIDALKTGEFMSADKKINYSRNVTNITIPALLIAARIDNLADPVTVRYAFDNISSKDKSMFIASKANGFSYNYGHTDLVCGKNAHKEIFPKIITWLNKRNPF